MAAPRKTSGRWGRERHSIKDNRPARKAAAAATALEPLEDRLLMFAQAGSWAQPSGLGTPVALRYSYSNLLNGGLFSPTGGGGVTPMAAPTIRASIEEALGVWTAVAPLQFTEVADFGPSPSEVPYGGLNFPEIRLGHHFMDGSPTTGFNELAHALPPTASNFFFAGALVGDVHFDDGDLWNVPTLTEVAAHELGHAIGLGHPNAANITIPTPALMDGLFAGNFTGPGTSFLFSDDVNGIRANYGAGLGWVLDSSGVLHVNGTGGNDSIFISANSTSVTVSSAGNGSFTRSLSGVNGISVMARGGNDVITVESDPSFLPITITGDAGNDTVNLAPGNQNLAALGSVVTFDGGSGVNSVFLNDTAGTPSISYTVGTAAVTRGGWSGMVYSNTQNITLGGAGGNCDYTVAGLPKNVNLTINDGSGMDTLNLAPAGQNLNAIQGNVSFAASGANGNWVHLFDQANPDNDTFTLASNSVIRPSWQTQRFGKLSWSGFVSSMDIQAGSGSNDINIADSSVFQLSVSGNGGNDRLLLSPSSGYVNSITGTVWFDGGPGTDMVFVNDSNTGSISDGDWTLGGLSLDKSNAPPAGALVSWATGSVENVVLYGGQWGTRYTVKSLPAGMTATLNAGGGDDTFDVGSPIGGARNVDGVQGTLVLNGQLGTNVLNYNDADNSYTPISIVLPRRPPPPPPRGDAYTLTGSTVGRDRSTAVNYTGVQTVNVYGGTAPNDFYVTPSAVTTFNVNGNNPTQPWYAGPPTSGEWDRITVDFSNTTSPVLTYNRWGGSGTYSFADRMAVNYSDIEFNNAPAVVVMSPPVVVEGGLFSTTPIRSMVLA